MEYSAVNQPVAWAGSVAAAAFQGGSDASMLAVHKTAVLPA
jgi:hypothetical protein